jgi:hypothetical protein
MSIEELKVLYRNLIGLPLPPSSVMERWLGEAYLVKALARASKKRHATYEYVDSILHAEQVKRADEDLAIRFLLTKSARAKDRWRDSEDLPPGRAAVLGLAVRERVSRESEEKLNALHSSLGDGKRVTVKDGFEFSSENGVLKARPV